MPLGSKSQLPTGSAPLVIGQERVLQAPRRKGTLRHAKDDHPIELEANRHRHRANEDAVTQVPDPAQDDVELAVKSPPKHLGGRRWTTHRVQPPEAVERVLDTVGGLLFFRRPTPSVAFTTEVTTYQVVCDFYHRLPRPRRDKRGELGS